MQHQQIFTRWRCTVHNCGSYDMKDIGRHTIDDICVIVKEDTVGIIKPKTFGGYNGDVSRKFLKDWEDIQKQKQRVESAKAKFDRYRENNAKRIYKFRNNDKERKRNKVLFRSQGRN